MMDMRIGGVMAFGASLVAGVAIAAPAVAAAGGPVVATASGKVEGTPAAAGSQVQAFRGIPYAAAPIGALRWREPQPVKSWSGVRPADAFGANCMQQHLWDDMVLRSTGPSEDCLFLNVWTPADLHKAASAKLPVLVYVYGGGLVAGDASERRYDGAAVAAQGIVVVTMNYRLGVLGFLAHPELTASSPHHASGNYGLLDQAAALAWVRRNIAKFGGDPNRITIGGESAGSMSVSGLMASPLTRGLIAGAIGESGALMRPLTPLSQGEGEQAGVAFGTKIGAPTLAALRALPADRILAAQGDDKELRFGAVVDNYYFQEPPAVTFASGKAAHVPLLVGSNSQENAYASLLGSDAPTLANYRAALTRLYADRADAVAGLYPAATDADVPAIATALASDRFLALATWKWFDLQRQTGAPTYYYYYTRVRPRALADPADKPLAWGALHSAEIEYALGNIDTNPMYAWTDEDRRVSATLNGYFVNFIKTGNPNGAGLPNWPKASLNGGSIERQVIDVETKTIPFTDQGRYVAAEPLIVPR